MNASPIAFGDCGAHDSDVSHFGKALIELRNRQGMTQDDLAQAAGVSRSLVQSAERMRVPKMRVKNYHRLAKALLLTPQALDAAWGQRPNLSDDRPRVETIDLAPDVRERLYSALSPLRTPDLARWLSYFADYLEANKAFASKLSADVFYFGIDRERKEEAAVAARINTEPPAPTTAPTPLKSAVTPLKPRRDE